MGTLKYYDTISGTWKYVTQGPKGDKGDTGVPGPANPGQTIPNITKELFFKRQIKAWARNQAVEYANRQALAAVVMEADN